MKQNPSFIVNQQDFHRFKMDVCHVRVAKIQSIIKKQIWLHITDREFWNSAQAQFPPSPLQRWRVQIITQKVRSEMLEVIETEHFAL